MTVYIEESERGQAYGSRLLTHGRHEAAKLGYPMIYLSTDHVGFYEKYGVYPPLANTDNKNFKAE